MGIGFIFCQRKTPTMELLKGKGAKSEMGKAVDYIAL